ncbi:hypothetical protein JTE90_005967 [Oedothorax gibbosus]|uniref:Uncharacterized protein n=1 Tax=Oedothorax gibbosus TaxID=931172 RepID=A0AAV6UXQ6_9ARAC|nr:hypothetical protein JTE90_005967 [Oedothorax gibbosus]
MHEYLCPHKHVEFRVSSSGQALNINAALITLSPRQRDVFVGDSTWGPCEETDARYAEEGTEGRRMGCGRLPQSQRWPVSDKGSGTWQGYFKCLFGSRIRVFG